MMELKAVNDVNKLREDKNVMDNNVDFITTKTFTEVTGGLMWKKKFLMRLK